MNSDCTWIQERDAHIKTLDLGNNSMTEEGAALVAALIRKKKLVELDLYNNDFGNEGMTKVSTARLFMDSCKFLACLGTN